MDLIDPEACLAQIQKLNITQLDILINNGGISQRDEFVNCAFSILQDLIKVNTLSPIALTKGFLPVLLKSPDGG
jgi:short-subunit dehydrogenase